MNKARWRRIVPVAIIAVALVGLTLGGETGLEQAGEMAFAGELILAGAGPVHIQLGDTVIGNVGATGANPVMVRFNAAEGTRVNLTVKMVSLQPTVALLDPSGVALDLGYTLQVKKNQAKVKNFVVPVSGNYAFQIGGVPGGTDESGHFAFAEHCGSGHAEAGSEAPNCGNPGRFTASTRGKLPKDVDFGSLSGTVVNALTGEGLAGVEITVAPYLLFTDDFGEFYQELPAGAYVADFVKPYFATYTANVTLMADEDTRLDVALDPEGSVVVNVGVNGDSVPGGELIALAEIVILDGSTVENLAWTQPFGAPAAIMGADMDIAAVHLADLAGYREQLFHVLAEPPIGPEQLPPNVPLPEGEFPGGLQDRFQVVGINPFALEEAALVRLAFEVTTTSGTYHDEVEIHTALPWRPAAGIRNVPVGIPVLLHGKTQATYDWTLMAPAASGATLMNASHQNTEFTPDVPGVYEVQVTGEDKSVVTLEVYAGTWRGVIIGQEPAADPEDDRMVPIADGQCTGCHGGVIADDQFTPWAQSGHAEIFSANLNTSTHYGPNCFSCHTVGFDPTAANDGFDDEGAYADFLAAGYLNNPGDNWTSMLEAFPDLSKKANIQCENCHGPQAAGFGSDSTAHAIFGPDGEPRTNLSSDVCATCHGEPLRHARFQQWQLSGHANYELAIDESGSGNCSRCHTANGFLKWLPVLLDDDPTTDPLDSVDVTWTADEAHGQTCVACHDPHSVGTTSGAGTNATVRITGDTPPLVAGFTAEGVGSGALCMTCHNSRRGLRNEDTFAMADEDIDDNATGGARAPHGSAQADLLFAQNAYLIDDVGLADNPNSHATEVENTCVTCHMQETPPPDVLSYNQGGTNHTFFASSATCSSAACHGAGFPGEAFLNGIHTQMAQLRGMIEGALRDLIAEQISLGNSIDLNGAALITDIGDVSAIAFGEARGRQAITVTFTDDTVVGPLRMTDVDVLDAADAVAGQLYDFAADALIKAGWNWNLLNNDGSRGGHNPTFATKVINASKGALTEAAATAAPGTSRGTFWRPRTRVVEPQGQNSERRHLN